jgi:hypothetical protein
MFRFKAKRDPFRTLTQKFLASNQSEINTCGGRANAAPSTQQIRQPVAKEICVIFNAK